MQDWDKKIHQFRSKINENVEMAKEAKEGNDQMIKSFNELVSRI